MNNWLDDKFVDALVDKVTTQLDCNSILAKKIRDSAMVSYKIIDSMSLIINWKLYKILTINDTTGKII